jgi:hypothetical protein
MDVAAAAEVLRQYARDDDNNDDGGANGDGALARHMNWLRLNRQALMLPREFSGIS